jgi:hypothetical protein
MVVRQCRSLFGRSDNPYDHETNDMLLFSDFVDECYLASDEVNKTYNIKKNLLGYVCICNDPNARKKKFKYVWRHQYFTIRFTNLYGDPRVQLVGQYFRNTIHVMRHVLMLMFLVLL